MKKKKKKHDAKGVKEPTDIGHALGKSNHKTHKLNSDPTLIKVKGVRSQTTMTVRFKSNGTYHACVLMPHRICVTRTHSLFHLSSFLLSLSLQLPVVDKP
ncbi:hypothetical protein VNO77_44691 [Canavalia gladiata]|uniref:Uncharacterized protein n=1 Tax=Canavalia gladiata TaxID=3824 RepID=A0AAN9JWE9_CANGL